MEETRKLFRHMVLTIGPLENDVNYSAQQLEKDLKNQFWRRAYIRCLLAETEALLWNMKHVTPLIAEVFGVQLTPEEIELANETRTVIVDNKPQTRTKFPRFRDNVKAMFALFAKIHGVTAVRSYDEGFEAFCATYEIRNRLMHPKRPFDLGVSDEDVEIAKRGKDWFLKEYHGFMDQCRESMIKFRKQ